MNTPVTTPGSFLKSLSFLVTWDDGEVRKANGYVMMSVMDLPRVFPVREKPEVPHLPDVLYNPVPVARSELESRGWTELKTEGTYLNTSPFHLWWRMRANRPSL